MAGAPEARAVPTSSTRGRAGLGRRGLGEDLDVGVVVAIRRTPPWRPARTAWRASYSGASEVISGRVAKLPTGGGDVVAHSSVWPSHGSSPGPSPRRRAQHGQHDQRRRRARRPPGRWPTTRLSDSTVSTRRRGRRRRCRPPRTGAGRACRRRRRHGGDQRPEREQGGRPGGRAARAAACRRASAPRRRRRPARRRVAPSRTSSAWAVIQVVPSRSAASIDGRGPGRASRASTSRPATGRGSAASPAAPARRQRRRPTGRAARAPARWRGSSTTIHGPS